MNRPSEELIFDRVQADVLNRTSKGKYEYTDLNRIELWCEYLAEYLNSYSYYVEVNVKTDWTKFDMPTVSEMERIRQNVFKLKNVYYSFTQIPSNLNYMDITKANAIEKNFNDIERIIYYMEQYFVKCGVCKCGQNRVWQQRFRRKYVYVPPLKTWDDLTQTAWDDFNSDEKWSDII